MLVQTAMSELPLLIFTLLVPLAIMGMALIAFVRGSDAVDDETVTKKVDKLLWIPGALMLVGLIAAFFHLGSPSHAFGMAAGIGRSPLSNEICVAGVSILIALIYWIYAAAKHPARSTHKTFGIILIILAFLTALFTGLAYMIDTVLTWNNPYGTLGQLGLAMLGGVAVMELVLACADWPTSDLAKKFVNIFGGIGLALVVVVLLAQGAMAGSVMNSASMTLAASMGQYWAFAIIGIILAVVAFVLFVLNAKAKGNSKMFVVLGFILVLVAFVFMRICFYGIYLTVGML